MKTINPEKICTIHYETCGYCVSPNEGPCLYAYGGKRTLRDAKEAAREQGYTHQWDGKRNRKL